nr:MAG TPA: hypothetical protein [Caudoviricetes sp.]DAN49156.1 MAG TPA: hypothetical protein [Caudoviricetes sp.]
MVKQKSCIKSNRFGWIILLHIDVTEQKIKI